MLDTKQRSLSLSQEGMALLFALLAEQPGVVFRWAGEKQSRAAACTTPFLFVSGRCSVHLSAALASFVAIGLVMAACMLQ